MHTWRDLAQHAYTIDSNADSDAPSSYKPANSLSIYVINTTEPRWKSD